MPRPSPRLLTELDYLPYLPLVYVAWADGELAPGELHNVRTLAAKELAPGIDDLPVLASWLDPDSPPTSTELLRVLRRIRELSHRVPPASRTTLATLGQAMARSEGRSPNTATVQALDELERTLHLTDGVAVAGLMADLGLPADMVLNIQPVARGLHFDRGALTRALDGKEHEIRNRVRDLVAHGALAPAGELDRAAYRARVFSWLQVLAAHRMGGLGYPQVLGESDSVATFMAAFEALADFDLSLVVKMGVQFGLFGGAIYFLGTERHHALLAQVASLELLGCFAMTETGHGSNVRALGTTATYDHATAELVVNTPDLASRKDYIGNAALHGRMAVVFAQLLVGGEGHGVHAVLVPIRDAAGQPMPGVGIGDCGPKMGLEGVDNGRLIFSEVRVPRENLLDRYGSIDAEGTYESPIASPTRRFFTMLGTLVGGRISVAAAAVGATRSALTIAIRYGSRRRQFGPDQGPERCILDYPTHQERLMPALAEAVVLTLALRELTLSYEALTDRARIGPAEEGDTRELEALAAGIKAQATWFATRTIQDARECCGGAGYLAENRFAELKADTDVFTTFEGDNTVLVQLAARGVLTAFSASLEGRWTGLMRHLAARAAANLATLDPVTVRRVDPAHLADPDFHLDTLRHRAQKLTWSAGGRLRTRIRAGVDPFEATVQVQDHLVSLGRAWTELRVLELASQRVEKIEDTGVKELLEACCALYALDRIWADQAWYLRHGVLMADKSRAVRALRLVRMGELRMVALEVCEGFGIPEVALRAPIATR